MRGFVKWIGAPVAFALLGFFGIGPYFAGDSKPVKMVQEAKARAESHLVGKPAPSDDNSPGTKADAPPEASPSDAPAPRVSVGVKPVDADAPQTRRRHRRHRDAGSDEAPPEATPETDRTGPDPASTP